MKRGGFSLVELLVALAVFSVMSALAYGGLNSIARARGDLAGREDAFRDLMRAVGALERDLRETVARPVRDSFGKDLPAFVGSANTLEFTRLGFANPQAEPRANLERVLYALDAGTLKRGRYEVLDRAPTTAPTLTDSKVKVEEFRLRYLDADNRWLDAWPPPQTSDITRLPRAVEWHLRTRTDSEIEGTVELVSQWPAKAPSGSPTGGAEIPPIPVRPGGTQ